MRFTRGETKLAIEPPRTVVANAPELHIPWNETIQRRSKIFSIATACVLLEISRLAYPKPMRKSAKKS